MFSEMKPRTVIAGEAIPDSAIPDLLRPVKPKAREASLPELWPDKSICSAGI